VANADIGHRIDARFRPYVVYSGDQSERIGAASLSLLASVASTVEIEGFDEELRRLAG
jgi:hypothetical protein